MEQEPDAGLELGRGAFERGIGRAVVRALERRVGNAPVHELGVRRELGTDLADAVAQRDHEVEPLATELVEVLGSVRADVDAALLHDPHRVGMERLRIAARATRLRSFPPTSARAAPRRSAIVRCSRCTGTRPAAGDRERPGGRGVGGVGTSHRPGCSAPPAACSCSPQRDEVDGVVAVPAIGRAATRRARARRLRS